MLVNREQISRQFEDLIREGTVIFPYCQSAFSCVEGEKLAQLSSWVTRSGQLIRNLSPKNSLYRITLEGALATKNFYPINSTNYGHISIIQGCLMGLYEDYKNGLLINIQGLLSVEVFDDFLDMAEYLLSEGYKDAAAVLAGAVLEDTLRKLAEKHGIPLVNAEGRPNTMEPLNQELYKASVISKLDYKQVVSWADLRNNAAHGHFDKYSSELVRIMLAFVRKFCADTLS